MEDTECFWSMSQWECKRHGTEDTSNVSIHFFYTAAASCTAAIGSSVFFIAPACSSHVIAQKGENVHLQIRVFL